MAINATPSPKRVTRCTLPAGKGVDYKLTPPRQQTSRARTPPSAADGIDGVNISIGGQTEKLKSECDCSNTKQWLDKAEVGVDKASDNDDEVQGDGDGDGFLVACKTALTTRDLLLTATLCFIL